MEYISTPTSEVDISYIQGSVEIVRKIIKICAKAFEVPLYDIVSDAQTTEIVDARHAAMHLADKYCSRRTGSGNLSQGKIGEVFNRDHSTVIHARAKVSNFLECEKSFIALYEISEKKIREELDISTKRAKLEEQLRVALGQLLKQETVELCPECSSIAEVVANPTYLYICPVCEAKSDYRKLPAKNGVNYVMDLINEF